jgi:mannosyl-3-phosphoglycerate phosphatase
VYLIFTDLDGTLLNAEDYQYEEALPVLASLQQQQVPVVPVTSKTRREVEVLRQQIAPQDPFIVENGSGLFVQTGDDRFSLAQSQSWDSFQLVQMGCSYETVRSGLRRLGTQLNRELQGFGDLAVEEIVQLTGLSPAEAEQAKAREFTEPFITPKTVPAKAIEVAAQDLGLRVVVGDRFSHLIGAQAGKGKAVQALIDAFRAAHPSTPVTTIGLGNSPNDRAMLETVDHAIVIPGRTGPHPGLTGYGWEIAPYAGAKGWAAAIQSRVLNPA